MPAPTPLLRFHEVDKHVRDGQRVRAVLSQVSFSLEAGQIGLLFGPSGSGKSTLLALAGLLDAPTKGEVSLRGEPTSRLRERFRAEARRHHIGFVFQHPTLLDDCSALDNVLYPAAPLGISRAHRQRAEQLLERFGLSALAKTHAGRLSGGEQQRVALARALLFSPPLLLCDEPTAHLDGSKADGFTNLLSSLATSGEHAVLIATHDARIGDALVNARCFDLTAAGESCTLTERAPAASAAAPLV